MENIYPLNDPTFQAFLNEGCLAAEMMAYGATIIGKADSSVIARYYQALFSISIGYERTAKLIICLHEIEKNGTPPSNFKKYSHNIKKLLSIADVISKERRKDKEFSELPDTPIDKEIIEVISEFAEQTRYFNLNLLSNSHGSQVNPVSSWYNRVGKLILSKYYLKGKRDTDKKMVKDLSEKISPYTIARHIKEDGSVTDSVEDILTKQQEHIFIKKFSRLHILKIARFLTYLISDIHDSIRAKSQYPIPDFGEIYAIFYNDDNFFKNKKTWSIYP